MANLVKMTECRGLFFLIAELSYSLSHSLQMGCETTLAVSHYPIPIAREFIQHDLRHDQFNGTGIDQIFNGSQHRGHSIVLGQV